MSAFHVYVCTNNCYIHINKIATYRQTYIQSSVVYYSAVTLPATDMTTLQNGTGASVCACVDESVLVWRGNSKW